MYEELNITAKELKAGDRAEIFHTEFADGTIINGPTQILKVDPKAPYEDNYLKINWDDCGGLEANKEKCDNLRAENKLILIDYQVDYYGPAQMLVHIDQPFHVYRMTEN